MLVRLPPRVGLSPHGDLGRGHLAADRVASELGRCLVPLNTEAPPTEPRHPLRSALGSPDGTGRRVRVEFASFLDASLPGEGRRRLGQSTAKGRGATTWPTTS